MKALIPVAGAGTRLRPHTYTAPKVLLQVAGKPILAHILDELVELGVPEITFIVGQMDDQIREFVAANYKFKANYVLQEEPRGLGHAISLADDYHNQDSELLIVLGDTIFQADLKSVFDKEGTFIGVKEVDDPRRFGIVELEGDFISRLVEKPEKPKTNLAIVGIYVVHNPSLLFQCLAQNIGKGKRTRGEFQLTDALQLMLERGEKMRIFPVEGWYDCGKKETLLATNRKLLALKYPELSPEIMSKFADSIIRPPVSISAHAQIENSILGPYVTVAGGAEIKNSIVTDSILGKNATVNNAIITDSIISDNAKVLGREYNFNVGDSSEVSF